MPHYHYGLPKIHKQGYPLHPIVNMTYPTPTYDIAKYLAILLKPLLGHTDAYDNNSTTLAMFLDNTPLSPLETCW